MHNLTPYPEDPFVVFKKIVASKQGANKARLEALLPGVEQHYANYCKKCVDLSEIQPARYADDDKEALLHCYTSPTEPLTVLRGEIRQLQGKITGVNRLCMYCALSVESTLDHYLPKERFPEFAVHALNLVPCCYDCNNRKGNKWVADGMRQFINLYYDRVLEEVFLHGTLSFGEGNMPFVKFELRENPLITQKQFVIIKKHYENLDLLQRYQESASSDIAEASRVINRYRKLGPNKVIKLLRERADDNAEVRGENYWSAVAWKSIAASRSFVEQVIKSSAPS